MVVKISWKEHDRSYTIGVKKLFDALDIEVSDEKIKKAIKKILSEI